MAEINQARSPLAGVASSEGGSSEAGIRLAERPFLGKLVLRGDGGDDFLKVVDAALGTAPPIEPNTAATTEEVSILWHSPDEWLIVTATSAETELANRLRESLGSMHAAVIDVSDSLVALRLSGSSTGSLLAKGCALDLHPRAFGPGQCAQTHLASALVTLHQIDDTGTWDIFVRASFAPYLWRWLEDASLEYGLAYGTG